MLKFLTFVRVRSCRLELCPIQAGSVLHIAVFYLWCEVTSSTLCELVLIGAVICPRDQGLPTNYARNLIELLSCSCSCAKSIVVQSKSHLFVWKRWPTVHCVVKLHMASNSCAVTLHVRFPNTVPSWSMLSVNDLYPLTFRSWGHVLSAVCNTNSPEKSTLEQFFA